MALALIFLVVSRQTKIRKANFARTCIKFDRKLREEISSLFLLPYLLKGIEPRLVRAPENRKIFGKRSKRAKGHKFCQKLCMSAVCDEVPLEATKKIALLPSYFRSIWHWRLFFWLFRAKRKFAKRILRELA